MSETNICRLCLKTPAIRFSILGNNITEMLESLSNQPLNQHIETSTFICLKCLLSVKLAYSIQQKIKKSEDKLLKLIKTNNLSDTHLNDLVNLCEARCVICGFCDENFSINDHIIGHFNEEQVCGICQQPFPNIQLMGEHLRDHSEKIIHQCGKCNAKFLYKSFFDKHLSLVCFPDLVAKDEFRQNPAREKRSKVDDPSGANLKSTQNHMTTAAKQKFKCSFCDYKFKKKSALENHHKKKHSESMFHCDTCGKGFYQLKHMENHVKMKHLKLRPFICKFCEKGYSSRNSLKIHVRIHTKETPYKCEVCGKGFRQNVCLRMHRKTKHGILEENTCECTVCGRGFASLMALQTHTRMLHS